MTKNIRYFHIFLFYFILFSFQANAQMQGLFEGGAVRVGPSTTTCDTDTKGAIRYNATDKTMEYCNETEWVVIGGTPPTPLNVADVFSTDLYSGNGSSLTITNGLDLAGEGGLVWIKARSLAKDHVLQDTARGPGKELYSNDTAGSTPLSDTLTSFNSDGFSIGGNGKYNDSTRPFVSWTFREAPKFFDIVTYTGDNTNRTIAHNLGVVPGMIVVKVLSGGTGNGYWLTYHRSASGNLWLNASNAQESSHTITNVTNSSFDITSSYNESGSTVIAYLFAHDESADGVIQCGSYTGNGSSSGPTVNLGWEPQWLLYKRADNGGDWHFIDSARGKGGAYYYALKPNSSAADSASHDVTLNESGFTINDASAQINAGSGNYIYCVIRAEP